MRTDRRQEGLHLIRQPALFICLDPRYSSLCPHGGTGKKTGPDVETNYPAGIRHRFNIEPLDLDSPNPSMLYSSTVLKVEHFWKLQVYF